MNPRRVKPVASLGPPSAGPSSEIYDMCGLEMKAWQSLEAPKSQAHPEPGLIEQP